jgi:hypothetical protein
LNGGAGQNVGYGDGHVSWVTNPYVGAHHDNIFTYIDAPTAGGKLQVGPTADAKGITSTGTEVELNNRYAPKKSPYDTVMVPVRNVKTGAW